MFQREKACKHQDHRRQKLPRAHMLHQLANANGKEKYMARGNRKLSYAPKKTARLDVGILPREQREQRDGVMFADGAFFIPLA